MRTIFLGFLLLSLILPGRLPPPESGETALLLAAGDAEQIEDARLFLERGAGVNANDWMGRIALFRAAMGCAGLGT